jgi:hypothetical protein
MHTLELSLSYYPAGRRGLHHSGRSVEFDVHWSFCEGKVKDNLRAILQLVLAATSFGLTTVAMPAGANELACVKLRHQSIGNVYLINSCAKCMEVVWFVDDKVETIKLEASEVKSVHVNKRGETLNERPCK